MFFLDLRVLKMATVYDIGAAAFNVLLTPIKDLRHLEMNGNEKLKAAFVQEVLNLSAFKETLSMEMKMVPYVGGYKLKRFLPLENLRDLNVSWCAGVGLRGHSCLKLLTL